MEDEIKEILDNPKILMLSYGNYISLDDYVKLKDYITNQNKKITNLENEQISKYQTLKELQEENERLKELCDKYEEEHKTTFEYWKRLLKEDYKSRNEKAIEYVEHHKFNKFGDIDCGEAEEIINILNGGDDNE